MYVENQTILGYINLTNKISLIQDQKEDHQKDG